MKLKEVYEYLKSIYPLEFAYEWDNVGLLLGREDKEVKKILVCLDITKFVIEEAKSKEVDLIISHHPLIFKPINNIVNSSVLGSKLLSLISSDISCICMHTNYDVAKEGMGEVSASMLGLQNISALEKLNIIDDRYFGLGVIGELEKEVNLQDFINLLKEKFSLNDVVAYGEKDKKIKKVAMLPGSGASSYKEALKLGADIFVSGDISHHNAIDALEAGILLIDASHYGIEKLFIESIIAKLRKLDINDIQAYYYEFANIK